MRVEEESSGGETNPSLTPAEQEARKRDEKRPRSLMRTILAPGSRDVERRLRKTAEENIERIRASTPDFKALERELRGEKDLEDPAYGRLDTRVDGILPEYRLAWARSAVIQWWMGLVICVVGVILCTSFFLLLRSDRGEWMLMANMVMGGVFSLLLGIILLMKTTRDILRLTGEARDGQWLIPSRSETFWEATPRAAVIVLGGVSLIGLAAGGFVALQRAFHKVGLVADLMTLIYVIALIVLYRRLLALTSAKNKEG